MNASEPFDSSSGCRPRVSISFDADSMKGLVVSLPAKIDDLVEQNKALLARIAELEGRAGRPPNSSLPPSSGQKGNVADASATKKRLRTGSRLRTFCEWRSGHIRSRRGCGDLQRLSVFSRQHERKLGVCRRLGGAMLDRPDPERIQHAMFAFSTNSWR